MPQRMALYEGAGSAANAALFYRARMGTLGWTEDHNFTDFATREGRTSLRFGHPDGREAVVDLSDSPAGVMVLAMLLR